MKEKIKILAKLIKENNASIEQQIEYYKLMIQITNSKTDVGSKIIERYSNKIEEVNKYNKEFFNNKKLLISKKDSCSHIKTEEQNETVILYYTMTDCVYLEDELEIIEVSKNIENIKIVEKEL